MKSIVSSNISKVGYDIERQELIIEFKSGNKYRYSNVPVEVYEGILVAQSPGKYIRANVVGSYSYSKE